jgi:hypothetical protein
MLQRLNTPMLSSLPAQRKALSSQKQQLLSQQHLQMTLLLQQLLEQAPQGLAQMQSNLLLFLPRMLQQRRR